MKVLIGSAGFIGFHLHDYLLKKNLKFMDEMIIFNIKKNTKASSKGDKKK